MKWLIVLGCLACVSLCSGETFEDFEDPKKRPKKSDKAKITLSIRKVSFSTYPEINDEYDQPIEYILERADHFNILGEDETIARHFGKVGTRIHIPMFRFIRRFRRRRQRAAARPRNLRQTDDSTNKQLRKRKSVDPGINPPSGKEPKKKSFQASSGRVLSAENAKPSPKVKRMFSAIFGSMENLKASKKQGKSAPIAGELATRKRRKLFLGGGGGPGGKVNNASASPQINDSRIIVHAFAAPAAAPQSYIKAPYADTSPQVIQTRMQLH